MSTELEYDTLTYDNGYGGLDGVLVVEVEPVYTDERFDAHSPNGSLSTFGEANAVTGCKFIGASFFAVDQDGGDIGQFDFDCVEDLKQFGIRSEDLLDKLIHEY